MDLFLVRANLESLSYGIVQFRRHPPFRFLADGLRLRSGQIHSFLIHDSKLTMSQS